MSLTTFGAGVLGPGMDVIIVTGVVSKVDCGIAAIVGIGGGKRVKCWAALGIAFLAGG